MKLEYGRAVDTIAQTAALIRLAAVFCILWPFSFVLPAALKGAGDARYTMVTSIIGMWLFRITLRYVLGIPLKLGVAGGSLGTVRG